MQKRLIMALLLLCMAVPALAQPKVLAFYGGLNAVWFDGLENLPRDWEGGVTARASLAPHISLVGSGFYGFKNQYYRGTGGIRITATDIDNPNFSVGFGLERSACDKPELRPDEWQALAVVGYRPWRERPRVVLGGSGGYGLESNQAFATLALRYALTGGN